MRITRLALSMLLGIGAGCTTVPLAPLISLSDLPNCFDANYDEQRGLFTIMNAAGDPVNQQCLLRVWPRGDAASASRLTAGWYTVYLANGGGGGAGGTAQALTGGGGGGGGGAGAMETQARVNLTEGVYKLTIGAGGPGGSACILSRTDPGGTGDFGGGPGWIGSPSNMVRVATGEVVIGVPGADRYVRMTRGQVERMAGEMNRHGGSGPGQASGGEGGRTGTKDRVKEEAEAGDSASAPTRSGMGGTPGFVQADENRVGAGGGGGATSFGAGGGGGGETPSRGDDANVAPERGSLGGGGGGGEANSRECAPGARGGHGYIALRPN